MTLLSNRYLCLDLFGVCSFNDHNNKILDDYIEIIEDMTVEKCLSICRSKGYPYSGLEWQIECHCGFEPEQGFKWLWPDKCANRCLGNPNQNCGGSEAISVWKTPRKQLNGLCVKDNPGSKRVLKAKAFRSLKTLTIKKCHDICKG